MALHRFQNNFTGGEVTPYMDGRNDFEKYDSSALDMQNMRPLMYGGATIRPGLKHEGTAKFQDTVTRLEPFNYSTGTRFVMEFGEQYVRFWYGSGGRVETSPGSGVPYEVATPYLSGEIFIMQVKNINDVVYIVHPLRPVGKLIRLADNNWQYTSDIDWTYPPLREENTEGTTITPSGTTGAITLTASTSIFFPGHVGSYWEIRHLREGDAEDLDLSASSGTYTSAALPVQGDWSLVTTERWWGTLDIERSTDGGATWDIARQFKRKATSNVSASGTEQDEVLLRMVFTATGDPYGAGVWQGAAPVNYAKAVASLEVQEAFATGLVKITGYNSGTSLNATVIKKIANTLATDIWSEGAWSAVRGWPRAVGLFEQRLYFGGTFERPLRFWGSRSGDFENFNYGDEEDAAVAFDVASASSNPISFLEGLQRLLIGTSGEEFSAAAGSQDEPLTPTNISVRGQSSYGSELYQPLRVDKAVLFVQRQGAKIREMTYSLQDDGYVAPDLTLLAEHLFRGGIHQLGFARQPDPLVLACLNSGVLGVMTYNREQNITAWAPYRTDGLFESACSVYGNVADEIWAVVVRIVNGQQYRRIERFARETGNKLVAKYLDAHVSGTITNPWNGVIGGLAHLEGKTVRVCLAGANVGDYVVSGGQITVPEDVSPTIGDYCVGLPYTAQIKTMRFDVNMATGPSQGMYRRICEATLRFYQTLGCKYGPSFDKLDALEFGDSDQLMDGSPDVVTGDRTVKWQPSGDNQSAYVCIRQDQPLPFTILGIAIKADIFGE